MCLIDFQMIIALLSMHALICYSCSATYLTIIHRRSSGYCGIIPETKLRALFDNIH